MSTHGPCRTEDGIDGFVQLMLECLESCDRVRVAEHFGPDGLGKKRMRNAFKPALKNDQPATIPGLLTDTQRSVTEQEAIANLFSDCFR